MFISEVLSNPYDSLFNTSSCRNTEIIEPNTTDVFDIFRLALRNIMWDTFDISNTINHKTIEVDDIVLQCPVTHTIVETVDNTRRHLLNHHWTFSEWYNHLSGVVRQKRMLGENRVLANTDNISYTVYSVINYTIQYSISDSECSSSLESLMQCGENIQYQFSAQLQRNDSTTVVSSHFLKTLLDLIIQQNTSYMDVLDFSRIVLYDVHVSAVAILDFKYQESYAPTSAPTKPPIVITVNIYVIVFASLGGVMFCGGVIYYCFTGTHANKRKINAVVASELDELDAMMN